MRAMIDIREGLKQRLREAQLDIATKLANGQAKDYSEYCKMTGRVLGTRDAVDIIEDFFKEMESNDE